MLLYLHVFYVSFFSLCIFLQHYAMDKTVAVTVLTELGMYTLRVNCRQQGVVVSIRKYLRSLCNDPVQLQFQRDFSSR